jgi:hypothetical protein
VFFYLWRLAVAALGRTVILGLEKESLGLSKATRDGHLKFNRLHDTCYMIDIFPKYIVNGYQASVTCNVT